MKKSRNKMLFVFSFVYYIIFIVLMIVGTFKDLQITVELFNPENLLARVFESFGSFVYWGIWGPAFTIIFLCRRDLNESLAVINKLVPAIRPVENTQSRGYRVFDFVLKAVTAVGFFVLAVVGWKKLIENILKNILLMLGKNDMSQAFYFIFCTVFTAIAVFVCYKTIDSQKLKKIESLALAGVLFGIFLKIIEECKSITNRVRVREMIAYSNGFLNEDGLSEGRYSPLTSSMADTTDFSAFTQWYKKGDDMGIYNRADSFPSGHTNYASASFLIYLLCSAYEKLKKLAPSMLIIAFIYTAVTAFTRLVAGAHYLTDVAAAAIIGYTLFLIVYKIYFSFSKKGVIG